MFSTSTSASAGQASRGCTARPVRPDLGIKQTIEVQVRFILVKVVKICLSVLKRVVISMVLLLVLFHYSDDNVE